MQTKKAKVVKTKRVAEQVRKRKEIEKATRTGGGSRGETEMDQIGAVVENKNQIVQKTNVTNNSVSNVATNLKTSTGPVEDKNLQ